VTDAAEVTAIAMGRAVALTSAASALERADAAPDAMLMRAYVEIAHAWLALSRELND
jgi:hypothetical protein